MSDSCDVDEWIADLRLNGWTEQSHTIWIAPDQSVWRGPYGAWCEMLRRAADTRETEVNRD